MSDTYQSNLAAIVGWHQFIEDISTQYSVSIETVYQIVLDILVMQQQTGSRA